MLENSQDHILASNSNKIHPEESLNVITQDILDVKTKPEAPKRQKGSMIWFIIITICTLGIPLTNLFLYQFQPISLARGIDKNNLSFNDIARSSDYDLFYVAMALYLGMSICFGIFSSSFADLKQRFKIHILVDNIALCLWGTNISYAALHIINFAGSYSQDYYLRIEVTYDVSVQDVFVIIFYCLANICFTGAFRLLIKYIEWKPCQLVIYKISVIICSLIYIGVGFVYVVGLTALNAEAEDYNTQVIKYIDDQIYTDANYLLYLDEITYLLRGCQSLSSSITTINNFVILYVFANFALFYEIVAKVTEYDQTSGLKTEYQFKDDDDE